MWTRKFALVLVLGLGRLGVAGADDDVTLFYSRQITSDDAPNIAYVPFAVHPDEPRLYAGITPRAGGDRPPKIGLAVFDTLTGEREKLNLYQAPGLDEDEQIGVLQGSLGGYATHPSDPALFVWGRSWSDDDKWRFVMIRYDLGGNEVAAERYDLEFDDPVAFAVRGGIDSDLLVLVDRPSDESLRLATFDFYGSLLDESTIEFGEDIRGAACDILSGMDGGEPSLLIAYSQNGLPEYSDGRVVQMSFSGEVLKTIEVPLEIGEAEDINFVVPRYLTHNSRQEIYVGYTVDMSSTGWEGRLNDVIVTPDGEIRDSPVHYNTRYVTATFQELDGERKEMLAWTSTNIATNDKALTRVAGAGAAGIDDDSIWSDAFRADAVDEYYRVGPPFISGTSFFYSGEYSGVGTRIFLRLCHSIFDHDAASCEELPLADGIKKLGIDSYVFENESSLLATALIGGEQYLVNWRIGELPEVPDDDDDDTDSDNDADLNDDDTDAGCGC